MARLVRLWLLQDVENFVSALHCVISASLGVSIDVGAGARDGGGVLTRTRPRDADTTGRRSGRGYNKQTDAPTLQTRVHTERTDRSGPDGANKIVAVQNETQISAGNQATKQNALMQKQVNVQYKEETLTRCLLVENFRFATWTCKTKRKCVLRIATITQH